MTRRTLISGNAANIYDNIIRFETEFKRQLYNVVKQIVKRFQTAKKRRYAKCSLNRTGLNWIKFEVQVAKGLVFCWQTPTIFLFFLRILDDHTVWMGTV